LAQRKTKTPPELKVVKDPTFHRAVADKILAIDLGRDFELAFLQGGPSVTAIVDVDETQERADLDGVLTEVARIRAAPPVIMAMVVNVLEPMVRSGKIKTDAFINAIRSWEEEARANEEQAHADAVKEK
jgi:hypothetical protein